MKKLNLVICTVLPSPWRVKEYEAEKFITDLFEYAGVMPEIHSVKVILGIEMSGRHEWTFLTQLAQKNSNFWVRRFESPAKHAEIYLALFRRALETDCDLLLEIDCSGAHDPAEIPTFLGSLVKKVAESPTPLNACTFSTRFSHGGKDLFPADRVRLSRWGTRFAQTFLFLGDQGKSFTDLTSGFEAFSAPLLRALFIDTPPTSWISVKFGPMHLIQTETRARICWLSTKQQVSIDQMPITYGAGFNRKLAPLSYKYLLKALVGAFMLSIIGAKKRFLG